MHQPCTLRGTRPKNAEAVRGGTMIAVLAPTSAMSTLFYKRLFRADGKILLSGPRLSLPIRGVAWNQPSSPTQTWHPVAEVRGGRLPPADEHCPDGTPPTGEGVRVVRAVVECAVYKADNSYRAVCFDLGLFVQRPTAAEAIRELHELMQSYIRDAQTAGLTWEETLRPVSRRERRYVIGRVILGLLGEWLRDLVGRFIPNTSHSSVGICHVPV